MGLLFFLYPLAEIYSWFLFIEKYSFLDALYLLIIGFILGSSIVYLHGKSALLDLQVSLSQGKSPATNVFHRALIMFGGLLIMAPGILSKMAGTVFVLPGFRHLCVLYFKWSFARKLAAGTFKVFMGGAGAGPSFGAGSGFGFDVQPQPMRDVHQAPSDLVLDVTPEKVIHSDSTDDSQQQKNN